jgi:tetratricopeptide (TPR) repeat protein
MRTGSVLGFVVLASLAGPPASGRTRREEDHPRETEEPGRMIDRLDEAVDYANEKLKTYHYLRGTAHEEAGEHQLAVLDYEAAVAIDEGFAGAWNRLGWVYYYHLGELRPAAGAFVEVIGDDDAEAYVPAGAYNGLAEILRRMREMEASIALHEKGVSIHPTCVGYHNLAWLYNTHRRDFTRAVALCETALEIDPSYEYGKVSLAVFLANDGRLERAKEMLEGVGETDPSMDYNLACYYAVIGETGEAIRRIERYLTVYLAAEKKREGSRKYMLEDWHLAPLRDDPRFIELMKPAREAEPPVPAGDAST